VNVRPAVESDLAAIAKIGLTQGDEAAGDPRYIAHLGSAGRFLVAEDDDGAVAGFTASRRAGDVTMLCDLFVDPARHGGGVGTRLLDAVLDGAGERFTFASSDPKAMSLYVRHGMTPRWPLFYLSGPPLRCTLRSERVPAAEAAAAHQALTGVDRAADYAYWATLPGGTGVVVRDANAIVAAGAAGVDRLRHLTTAEHADPTATLVAALSGFDTGTVGLCLPGPHPALPLLLGARWRIEDTDQHLSTREGLLSPHLVPSASLG
jgi:GNAT superfamily N-acetyltransferase